MDSNLGLQEGKKKQIQYFKAEKARLGGHHFTITLDTFGGNATLKGAMSFLKSMVKTSRNIHN